MQKVGNALVRLMQDLSRLSTNGTAHVKVNRQLCEPQQFKSLFQHFTKGTILEHLDLRVEPLNTQVECSCGYSANYEGGKGYTKCPECGRFAEVKDNAYSLESPDPSKAGMRKSIKF
ncbi:MAG: hydrogenase/urease maturation nickel metallochaperone HypA [Candidatus Nanohalobium sp.]